jgi:hypothetical protein
MTEKYSKIIEDLRRRGAPDINTDFETGVWSRVSQIENKQLARGRNGLAAIMLVTALSVGMLSGGNDAIASSGSTLLSHSPDYSPAALLHVLP